MAFYLGTHEPSWLRRATVPLFLSHLRLSRQKRPYQPAVCRYAVDSGGFSEIAKHGRWTIEPEEYVAALRRYAGELGPFDFAAPQDWMCEPPMLALTGLTVEDHQELTVANFLELRRLAPDLPIIPVIQGWTRGEYGRCIELYRQAGVDLAAVGRVGVGSVCRRQSSISMALLFDELAERGLRDLHGFGVKTDGLDLFGSQLASADSLAWSYAARREGPLPACRAAGKRTCSSCLSFALAWRDDVLLRWPRPALTAA